MSINRRRFLTTSGTSAFLSGGVPLLPGLRTISASDTALSDGVVQLRPEIEPLVKLIEDTDRSRLIEEMARRIRDGLSYREVLAALFLAGVRNVQPRPSVGFKFHAVLVVHSAHLASLASPDEDRWLPLLWALDEFKSSQARDVEEGNWTMSRIRESGIPAPERVRDSFHQAMLNWQEDEADLSAAGVARHLSPDETLELFATYAARDFRSIGHKPIFLANAWRTLQTIGWEHSEPVLRSLAYAMLNHNGEPNPARSDLAADRSWRRNQDLIQGVRPDWAAGREDHGAVQDLIAVLHAGSAEDAAKTVVNQLNSGVSTTSIYDALHLASGELLMRQSGIVSLHAATSTNAIRFLFDNIRTPATRLSLLLQNASFLPQFREAMRGRGAVAASRVMQLSAADPANVSLDSIFANVGKSRQQAGSEVLTYLNSGNTAESLINAARRLVFLKGNDSHDYKFSSAVLEDCLKVSEPYRSILLAASSWMLQGTTFPENALVNRIRAALG